MYVMTIGDIIALLTLVLGCITAIIGGVYTIVNNTKKFELAEDYKKELISWYSQVAFVIEKILSTDEKESKVENLGKLSALIDIGRLYFPNIIKDDGWGKDKPLAHQGHRHIALGYLVRIYRIVLYKDVHKHQKEITNLKKKFNSSVFAIISPRERLEKLKIYAKIDVPESTTDDEL